MAKEMKALNGYEIVDKTARDKIDNIINPNILMNTLSVDLDCPRNWEITRINSVNTFTTNINGCTFTSSSDPNAPDDSNGIGIQIKRNDSGLKTGDTVTFSANIKGTIVSGKPYIQYWASNKSSSNIWARRILGDSLLNISPSEYKRYKVTVTLEDLYEGETSEIFAVGGGYGSTITFRDIKLEYGSKDTSSSFEFLRTQLIISSENPKSSYGRNGDIYLMI